MDDMLALAVFGAHLSGEPLNHQLVAYGGWLAGGVRTAPVYRFVALADGRPGLVRVDSFGASIEGEVWHLPVAGFALFVAAIPAPLGIGKILLENGDEVPGFLCESYATSNALDITSFGGWRAWRSSSLAALQGK